MVATPPSIYAALKYRRYFDQNVISVAGFKFGIVSSVSPRSIPRAAASDSLNWLTKGDKIELRPGQAFLGTSSVQTGNGKASGIRKTTRADNTEQLFGTFGKKLSYYSNSTLEWVEVGSDLLGTAVVDSSGFALERISMSEYVTPAGNQLWVNSPHIADIFKLFSGVPGSYAPQYASAKNFKGNIKIDSNRTLLWGTTKDKTGVYGSYIDNQAYTTVSSETIGTGDGATLTFSKYLNFKTKATGTLTSTGTNVTDGDTVTIGTTVYRFKTTMAQAFDVQRDGSTAAQSLVNLKAAVNLSGTVGTNYFAGTTIHPTVEATAITATTLVLLAKTPGTGGNAIATTKSAVTLSFGAVTLTGGVADPYTSFGFTVTAGSVILTDDYCGNLTSSTDASVGTINYATGLISVTFAVAPTISTGVTAGYQWEDSTAHGIADFTKSGTRLAGEGFVFRQDEGGGPVQNIGTYASIYFCLHLKKTWALTIGQTDTSATNLPYRQNVGIPGALALVEAGEGIYYIDASKPDEIMVRILTYTTGGAQQIIPIPVSNNIKLQNYLFDQAAGLSWGDLVMFSCRTSDSPVNNRVIVYNRKWKCWDILDYNANCFDIFNGGVVVGDSISNNFISLFSGFDDLGSPISNYWIGNIDTLSADGLKKIKKFYAEGEIAPDQNLEIWASFDSGPFVLLGTISGKGSYVDTGRAITIGSQMIGDHEIGGDTTTEVYHYERLFPINTDKFEVLQIKYVATDIGYVSVRQHKYWDVRTKSKKAPVKYRG